MIDVYSEYGMGPCLRCGANGFQRTKANQHYQEGQCIGCSQIVQVRYIPTKIPKRFRTLAIGGTPKKAGLNTGLSMTEMTNSFVRSIRDLET